MVAKKIVKSGYPERGASVIAVGADGAVPPMALEAANLAVCGSRCDSQCGYPGTNAGERSPVPGRGCAVACGRGGSALGDRRGPH